MANIDPKIGHVWEEDIDRTHINVFVIKEITSSTHEIEITCEILEGEKPGTIFQAPISSFNNANWRWLYPSIGHHFDKKSMEL